MFTALLLLFFVIMMVVFFARALSQQRWSQRGPNGYPDMSQMQQQQMPPQAAPYSDPYSDTGYYQPGQEQAAPPPKEADTYDQGYAAGYTARPEPGTTPRADEEGDIYKARLQPEPRGNYDSSYYRPGENDATRSPERHIDADAPPPRRQEPHQPSNQGPYPPQRPDYGAQQPPMQQYQQPDYNQQVPPMQYPQQPGGYGQQLPPQYQQPFYGPYPPQQRSGMNPWVVGGLGALMGYGLGHMFGEEQGRDIGPMGGDFGGGSGDSGGGDFGGFGGGDSGGGDF